MPGLLHGAPGQHDVRTRRRSCMVEHGGEWARPEAGLDGRCGAARGHPADGGVVRVAGHPAPTRRQGRPAPLVVRADAPQLAGRCSRTKTAETQRRQMTHLVALRYQSARARCRRALPRAASTGQAQRASAFKRMVRPTDSTTETRIITKQPTLPPRGRIRTGLMAHLYVDKQNRRCPAWTAALGPVADGRGPGPSSLVITRCRAGGSRPWRGHGRSCSRWSDT